jgi:hypothetical protein
MKDVSLCRIERASASKLAEVVIASKELLDLAKRASSSSFESFIRVQRKGSSNSLALCYASIYLVLRFTVVHLIAGRYLIAGSPPNLTQVKIWEYLKMETLIEHE